MLANNSLRRPFIQDYKNLSLTSLEREVLELLFVGYEHLVLKAEFGGGFGGGRVLLVRPITADGVELPAVVKLGQAAIIQQEWQAVDEFVRRKVPKVARIEGEPVFTLDGRWGGIRYQLAGDGRFRTESLGTFCLNATADDAIYVLKQQLFPSLGVLWQDTHIIHEFFLARSLDSILPVNLIVTYVDTVSAASPLQPGQLPRVGAEVILSDFEVMKIDSTAGELLLDLPAKENQRSGGFRMRVTDVPDVTAYQVSQLLPWPITGRVQATRYTWLQAQIERIFHGAIKATNDTVSLPKIGVLPNPLEHLPGILNQTRDTRVGVVHGDLNLENVLVEYDDRSRNIYLIDFAKARRDWVLHDLLRLETSFWLYLVSAEMVQNERSLADLRNLLAMLHTNDANSVLGLEKSFRILASVRQMAQHLLVNPQSWDEYYQGLVVYLLGALKFRNLDDLPTSPLPKQIAFVAAAFIQQLQKGSLRTSTLPSFPSSSAPEPSLPKSELLRQIRFRFRKLELFESDRELRSVFKNNQELYPWADRLPEVSSRQSRADTITAFLLDRYSADNQNALVIFLRVLVREYNDEEYLCSELARFADQLQSICSDQTNSM